jgi:2-iminoacetate synthase ThiH
VKLNRDDKSLYYLENGKVVFTPEYHIKRGYCCGNGCRHCPYYPKSIKGNTKLEALWEKINQQNTEN